MSRKVIALALASAFIGVATPAFAEYPVPFNPVATLSSASLANNFRVQPPNAAVPSNAIRPTVAVQSCAKPTSRALPSARVNQPVAPKLSKLPKNANVVVEVTVNRKTIVVGTGKTTAQGTFQVPVVKFTKAGNHTITAHFSRCKSVNLRVSVRN